MRLVRPLLWVFVVTTFIGLVQLYVRYDSPDVAFAWTIEPPPSAAFLGAGYAAGFLLTVLTLRDGRWATARIAVLTVLVFTWLTLLVTLVHLDRFNLDSDDAVRQVAAWLWLGIYVTVPPAMAIVLYLAVRAGEEDSPVLRPMGPVMRIALVVVGSSMLAVGVGLLVDPEWVGGEWPWELTPLTGRAIGAWLLPLGLAALWAIREQDLVRLRPASLTFALFGVLLALALVRYGDDVSWDFLGATLYLVWLAVLIAIGLMGTVGASGAEPEAGRQDHPGSQRWK